MALIPAVKPGDWKSLNRYLRKLTSLYLGSQSNPTFGGIDMTGDIDMNNNCIVDLGCVQFNLTPTVSQAEGKLYWNSDDGTLNLGMPGGVVNLQIGQESLLRSRNASGGDMTNGQIIYVSGESGNKPTIELARADTKATANGTIGMLTEDIDDNSNGYVNTFGLVRGIKTDEDADAAALTEGDEIFLSDTVAGGFTKTIPLAPCHAVKIGYVLRAHATEGMVLVTIDTGTCLCDLHDVLIDSLADDDLIQYDSAAKVWKNTKVIENLTSIQAGLGHFGTDTNYSNFEADGTLKFNGTAAVWNDINRSFSSARVPAANAPSWTSFVGNLNEYTFGINDLSELEPIEMLHDYQEGTDIEIHLHWVNNGLDGTDRYVKWEVEYTIANMGDPLNTGVGDVFPAPTVVSVEKLIPANTPDRTHLYVDLTDITGTSVTMGAAIKMRIRRITADGTAPSGNPFALMVGIHYEVDTVGSRTEYTK